jgi:sulfur carrier protein
MELVINGEQQTVANVDNVADLLQLLDLREDRVAVEVNLHIVQRDQRATYKLMERDKIEIVSFIGGG